MTPNSLLRRNTLAVVRSGGETYASNGRRGLTRLLSLVRLAALLPPGEIFSNG